MEFKDVPDAAGERILGVDAGDRRIGIAVSGPPGVTAHPLLTLESTNRRRDVRSLAHIARKWNCVEIVLGYPLSLSGAPSRQSAKVEKLAEALRKETGLPVHLWDERLSTAEAHRYLDEAGRPRAGRRPVIDQLAAVLILQTFLDARSVHRGDHGVADSPKGETSE